MYSHDLYVWSSSGNVMRNYWMVTIRAQLKYNVLFVIFCLLFQTWQTLKQTQKPPALQRKSAKASVNYSKKASLIHSVIFILTNLSSTHFGLTWETLALKTLAGKFTSVAFQLYKNCYENDGWFFFSDCDFLVNAFFLNSENVGYPVICMPTGASEIDDI